MVPSAGSLPEDASLPRAMGHAESLALAPQSQLFQLGCSHTELTGGHLVSLCDYLLQTLRPGVPEP